MTSPPRRAASRTRLTNESSISLSLALDGRGEADISTGVGFLDHLLHSLALHARFDLRLRCDGDLHVDDHHTAEDVFITVGEAIDECLGDRAGIRRFGSAYAPLDESLARVVVDLVRRPAACIALALRRDSIGGLACENIGHGLVTLATSGRFTLHVDVLRGENDHHKAEAAFKALALALREAAGPAADGAIASTKGAM